MELLEPQTAKEKQWFFIMFFELLAAQLKWPQVGPKMAQVGRKMAKLAQDGPKLDASCQNGLGIASKVFEDASNLPKLNSKWV